MRHTRFEHRFVEHIPECLEPGILYICMEYATAVHSCGCGCGEEVVTPFAPTDWRMMFDGETVSLWPSIGNWNFACRSHYVIQHGQVVEAGAWTDDQVEFKRRKDRAAKALYYATRELPTVAKPTPDTSHQANTSKSSSPLKRLLLFIQQCFNFAKQFF
jgi:hypothetical protein